MTPSDRELLELAAKASGLPWYGLFHDEESGEMFIDIGSDDEVIPWNPLTDDGDALRLAVATGKTFVVRTLCVTTMGGLIENFDPTVEGDDLRATRRVIVRAAAEIGKGMK